MCTTWHILHNTNLKLTCFEKNIKCITKSPYLPKYEQAPLYWARNQGNPEKANCIPTSRALPFPMDAGGMLVFSLFGFGRRRGKPMWWFWWSYNISVPMNLILCIELFLQFLEYLQTYDSSCSLSIILTRFTEMT